MKVAIGARNAIVTGSSRARHAERISRQTARVISGVSGPALASVTLGGVGTAPTRAREVEQAIVGELASPELFRAACESCRKFEALDDVHAPASYRQHLAAVLSRRALEKAHARLAEPAGARVH